MIGLQMWQSQGWQLKMSDFAMYDLQTILRYVISCMKIERYDYRIVTLITIIL